ncbi:MAG: Gfo/Idh/MocA family oxidoreductase, partial [Kiritimatiellae bacterium]|nr:Gfo/Idh/MocA family oxidoreductase [Kiritimatiellia bacterium]
MKRIAIVGCGQIAKVHGLAIQDLGFECAAVTDIIPEAAQTFARNYPELRADCLKAAEWMMVPARKQLREMFKEPKVYKDLRAMKAAGPLDAVIIATLPGSHCELTCQAADIGAKAVLCEKPMAMSLAQCRRMIDVCQSHNTRLAVYNEDVALLRYVAEARHFIAGGRLGKIEFVHAN